MDFDALTHYDGISFEERCRRALVPLHEALDLPEPRDWHVIDARGKRWSKSEVLKLREDVDRMEKPQRDKFLDEWSTAVYRCLPGRQ